MVHRIIEEVFGGTNGRPCDLYKDVLQCPRDADAAALRKAYYRAAVRCHPDKNPGDATAAAQFQAVTAAYQLLLHPDRRAAYDATGVLPDDDDEYDTDDSNNANTNNQWKDFFDRIFGKVSVGDIQAFGAKYKCSDEEQRDVLKEYEAKRGNLIQMLEYVMLSEPRDAPRWVEDYIRPAIAKKTVSAEYTKTMETTLQKLIKKIEKEDAKAKEDSNDDEDDKGYDETESEDDNNDELKSPSPKQKSSSRTKSGALNKGKEKVSPKKAKPTQVKGKSNKVTKTKNNNDMSDLVAQIQNRRGGGGSSSSSNNMFANLGARYGASMMDDNDDPLNDAEFEKIQSKLKNRTKR